jgi:hypothetical protein
MLNQQQQIELQAILESHTFKAAKEEVLRMTDGSVEDLPAPEAGIKMALEKGARNAFRILQKISQPSTQNDSVTRRSISHTKK